MKLYKGNKLLKIVSAACLSLTVLSSGILSATAESVSSDLSDQQWYFSGNNSVQFPDWNDPAKNNVDPSKNAVIAVVDSGIDSTHEDFAGVLWNKSNYSEEQQTKLTELGFGNHGMNVFAPGSEPTDEAGHGTHVAGIIAAKWNNIGVSGALNGVRIMAVKATVYDGKDANATFVYEGLQKVLEAKKAGVNIVAVNLSWGGNTAFSDPELMDDVMTCLGEEGVVTVMAAGNSGMDMNEQSQMASFLRSNPYVITVAASDKEGKIAANEQTVNSNYGTRYVDVAAPGVDILSTYPRNLSETGYKTEHGTSMAAPIVTALAALVYDRYSTVDGNGKVTVKLNADEIASRVITSANSSALSEKIYSGLVNAKNAIDEKAAKPLAYYGRYRQGSLTVWGSGFGSSGTIQVNDRAVSSSDWSDGSIKVSVPNLNLGENIVSITRNDGKTCTRWIVVTGSTAAVTELCSPGSSNLEGLQFLTMAATGGVLYQVAMDASDDSSYKKVLLKRLPGATSWTAIDSIEFGSDDMDGANGWLYFIDSYGNELTEYNPSTKETKVISLKGSSEDSHWMVRHIGDRILVGYTLNEAIHVAAVNSDGTLNEIAAVSGNSQVLDIYEYNGSRLLLCKNQDENKDIIRVYKINEADHTAEKLFEKKYSSTGLNAFGYKDRIVVTPIITKDSKGSYSWSMDEYELKQGDITGKHLQTVILGGGHLHETGGSYMIDGVIADGIFYSNSLSDAARHNVASLMIPLKGYVPPTPPTPTPTPTPTPAPTPAPTSAPSGGGSTPAPGGSTVVTCQDAGYAPGWYWDESKKACVAPKGSSNPSGGKSGKINYGGKTSTVTPGGSGGDKDNPSASPDPDETAEPSASADPTATPTMTPDESATPTPDPKLPVPIVNTKGIMWFLGIPLVMIIAGLALYLISNNALTPWIIGADALIGLILAILDHSLVGWILLVLNLAAVGLMALYRMGKKEEE